MPREFRMYSKIALIFLAAVWPLRGVAMRAADLDLRPIQTQPEPLSRLDPKLSWMTQQKVRGIWIGDDYLSEKFEGGEKTKAQVIADAGFNLVCVSMRVNSDNKASGVVDTSKPLELKHDRSKSTDLEIRLAPNVAEAHRTGLSLMITWQYGTHHLEPYRKYRTFKGALAEITCCPLDETYIAAQHVSKWAVQIAQGGADGMILDMEMYHSDNSWPEGACTCDDCFSTYLKEFAKDWQAIYDKVPADGCGAWLSDQKADEHYAAFAAQRTEALYDSIRQRCQQINPAFFFGVAPQLEHFPGVERGLGTASVPCLVFSEHEYRHGPYRDSFAGTKQIRHNLPALFLCGAYVADQAPQTLADNLLIAGLYTNGWWAYYGTALLTEATISEGRVKGSTARDYLDCITAAHAKLDALLTAPQDQWPEQIDGKLVWLKAKIVASEAALANSKTDEAAKILAEAKDQLEKYLAYVQRMGGY